MSSRFMRNGCRPRADNKYKISIYGSFFSISKRLTKYNIFSKIISYNIIYSMYLYVVTNRKKPALRVRRYGFTMAGLYNTGPDRK